MKTCYEPLSPLEQSVREILLQVIDPEVGENIVDLGLVYGIKVEGNVAKVNLTLTSQAVSYTHLDVYKRQSKGIGNK